jgi:hypothetical protein
MAMQFPAHGEFITHVEGRFIISEVTGPWNVELAESWSRDLHPYAKMMSQTGPHVGIAVMHGSLMCPLDAFELMRKSIAYAALKLHCIGNVIVAAPEVEGRSIMQPYYARVYKDIIPHRFVTSLDEALAWGRSLLAEQDR